MVAPGEGSAATTLCPSPTLGLRSRGKSDERTLGQQDLCRQDVQQVSGEVTHCESRQSVFTHGLHHKQHFSCGSPVRFMMHSDAAAAFISIHADHTVRLYKDDGREQTSPVRLLFTGLTATKVAGRVVGWGPGPIFTVLDRDLRPLDAAADALDIRVCQPAEHSSELVTAGVGNVCVWSVMLMRCKVKIQEGLHNRTFTHMALAPPRSDRPHRAFVVCGWTVTVVDLHAGKVLEDKKDLCSSNITAIEFCSHPDCLIVASADLSFRVWGPDWELRAAFVGHNGVVNSLFYCSELRMLLSASVDCTIRCWDVEEGDVIECVHTELNTPPLCIGGTTKGDTFFSFSQQGVDFWSRRNLYNLHCKLTQGEGAPLTQILVSPQPAPYPIRVLCVSEDSDVTLVAAETGVALTSFKAKQRILCADYCLHKEILLVLTEAGTVVQANTLTNPISLMQEWKGRGQGPWQHRDHVTENDAQNLPVPGPPCCMALYSYVADSEEALEGWRSLQERRGSNHRNKATLDDAKNRFLIILGQSGGCVSVLTLANGKVLFRTPAHGGQKVTTVQVYPENGCLLSAGEDLTVEVWKVNPFTQECLSRQLSVNSGQRPVHMAVQGPQLALTFPEPNSVTYNLMHFNLLSWAQSGQLSREGHLDHITGLCACPDLEVFVSSSVDGTLHIWNEENHLIRTLQLNAVPECLAYGGFGGDLFLGVRGDLHKMNCADFLPHKYQQMLTYTYCPERLPDLPITKSKEKCIKRKSAKSNREEASDQLLTEDMWREKEYERLLTSNMDLSALLQGTVKCKKQKPPSTKQTKKEAFESYMKIIYGLSPNIKIDLEDTSEKNTFSFYIEPKTFNPPPLQEDVRPKSNKTISPVVVKKKKLREKKAPAPSSKPKTPMKVKPQPPEKVTPKKPVIVEEDEEKEEPPEIIPPTEKPKPRPPAPPPPRPKIVMPLPPREPTPEVPKFLKQFEDTAWFRDLFPDKTSIPTTLSPEDFSLQLLGYLNTCSAPFKLKILSALKDLHSQGLFQSTDKLYQGLIDLVPKCARPHMSPLERTALVEMLYMLMCLRPVSYELIKKILTLLAFKDLSLREALLHLLTALGVDEAEQWLWPELESWDSDSDQHDVWKSLHDRAECWLELWISKYKEHNRYPYLQSTANWKPPSFSPADVLNYFCSVQKEEYRKARCVAPPGPNNTVLLPQYDCFQPILRLGETYSMARIRKPPGIILPPLRNRPFLMHFPNFISLPLSRITLSPFYIYSDKDWLKASSRRYFIQQQSYIEYYR